MTVKELETALSKYLDACYGNPRDLSAAQAKELSQAFLSGVYWRDCEPEAKPGECEEAIRLMLGIWRERN